MALRKGLPVKLGATDADDTRFDFRNLVVGNSDGTPRAGVTSPVGVPLLSATSTMNVAVAPFNAVAARDGGVVLLSNDAVQNVLLDAAPAANSRIDVIVARQNDSSSTVSVPDTDDTPALFAVKGTASATPVKPAIPAGGVEVGTVQIPSGATATNSAGVVVTTTCAFTAAPGGVVPFRTKASLDAWATACVGQKARVIADPTEASNGDYVRDGGEWAHVPRLAAGTGVRVFTGVTSGTFDITFPEGRFTVPPVVTVIGADSQFGVYFSTKPPTTTKVQVQGFNGQAGLSVPYQWIAVQA